MRLVLGEVRRLLGSETERRFFKIRRKRNILLIILGVLIFWGGKFLLGGNLTPQADDMVLELGVLF